MSGTAAWAAFHPGAALLCVSLVLLGFAVARSGRLARYRRFKLSVLLAALAASAHAGIDMSPGLARYVTQRWGASGAERVLDWRARIAAHVSRSDTELSRVVSTNVYWNRIRYAQDPQHWREADYWATPVEMLASNGGDCEDYVFGKYFTLRALGVPTERLRIAYARAQGVEQGHMVLAYYATPNADPLILDNLTDDIVPASQRTDLQPVYSFNDDDLWTAQSNDRAGGANQVRAWRDLLQKMARERVL